MTPYYSDEWVTLYHGDCREILPTVTAHAAVTDPPYGTETLGGGYGRRQNWDSGDGNGRTIAGDVDLSTLREAFPLLRAAVPVGWAMAFYAPRRTPEACGIFGADWFGEVVWDKQQPGLGYSVRYAHESIAVLRFGAPPRPTDPLRSIVRAWRGDCLDHPHEKPLLLMAPLVAWCCPADGTVLDPFAGVGSTLSAAKALARRAIGIEIEERYCEIAAKRLAQGVLWEPPR